MPQSLLEPLPPTHRRVHHPSLIGALFRGFDPARGRFVPSDDLAFEYPGSGRSAAALPAAAAAAAGAPAAEGSLLLGGVSVRPEARSPSPAAEGGFLLGGVSVRPVLESLGQLGEGLSSFVEALARRDAAAAAAPDAAALIGALPGGEETRELLQRGGTPAGSARQVARPEAQPRPHASA